MATTPFPIPRGLRQTEILNGNGGAVYGPFDFQIFDVDDVKGFVRSAGHTEFVERGLVAKKVNGLPQDFFTVTFAYAVPADAHFVIAGMRLSERSAGVRKGSQLDPTALEKEISKQAVTQQELRRDVERSLKVGFGQTPQDLPASDGVSLLGWDNDGKLVNRQTDGISLAQAEAAAQAAISAVPNAFPPTRPVMAAYPPTIANAMLTESGRVGQFIRTTGDQSARVAADPAQIGAVPFVGDPTGASGAYIWVKMPRFDPRRAGAVGDVNGANSSPDDWQAMQHAMNWAASERCILELDRPYRIGQSNKGRASSLATMRGQLTLRSQLYVEGLPDGLIRPVGFSWSGSIITNLVTASLAASIVQGVRMNNVAVDMSGYEPFVLRGDIAAATSTTVTLPAIDSDGRVTSTVDGAYNGLILQIVSGPGLTEYAYLTNYIGATRTATFVKPGDPPTYSWLTVPTTSSKFELGWNDNAYGLSGGFTDGEFFDCSAFNVPIGILNAGGKGFNCENGVERVIVSGFYGKNIGGALTFAQGHDGVNDNGSLKAVRNVIFKDFVGEDCGALLAALALEAAADPDGDPNDNQVRFLNGSGRRCGHMDRRISAVKAKSAAIILGEAANVTIENIVVNNTQWSITYTTDPDRVGYGFTNGVDMPHAIQGWGRNVDFRNGFFYGNFGSLVSLRRARAFGDDASPTGIIQNTYRVKLDDIKHQGTINPGGYPIMYDATLAPADIELRVLISRLGLNSDVTSVFDPTMVTYTGLEIENISDWFNSRNIPERLSAKRFIELGNTVATVKARLSSRTYRKTFQLVYDVTSAPNGGDIAATAERSFTIATAGVVLTENNAVYVSMNGTRVPGILLSAQVTANAVVTVYVNNTANAAKNIGSRTYTVHVDTTLE